MYEHDYVKGIFCISSLFMMQVTIIDYMMKILAKERYAALYPNDPKAALEGFAAFMGYFGQVTYDLCLLRLLTLLMFDVLMCMAGVCVCLFYSVLYCKW